MRNKRFDNKNYRTNFGFSLQSFQDFLNFENYNFPPCK